MIPTEHKTYAWGDVADRVQAIVKQRQITYTEAFKEMGFTNYILFLRWVNYRTREPRYAAAMTISEWCDKHEVKTA